MAADTGVRDGIRGRAARRLEGRTGLRLGISATLAATAAILTWLATIPAGGSAELDMRVLEDEVRWPYLESVIKAQRGYLEEATVEEIAGVSGVELDGETKITSTLPTGGASFTLEATAGSDTAAVEAVEAAADWLTAKNLEERTAVLRAEADTLEEHQLDLESEMRQTETALEVAGADSVAAVRLEEELRQSVRLSAETSAEVIEVRTEERLMVSPIVPVGEARSLDPTQRQGATAAATGVGVLLIALAVTARRRPR
ncbi:MAG: hypothetical protein ACR2QO_09840 [Acidimicrobiales bacterium]